MHIHRSSKTLAKMSLQHLFLAPLLVIASLSSQAWAETGTATYYTPPYLPSACYGNVDKGVMIAAASDALWDGGSICGTRYRVKCVSGTNLGVEHPCKHGKSVTVLIADYCPPPGCHGTIDLSQEAFHSIAVLAEGKINIDYQVV